MSVAMVDGIGGKYKSTQLQKLQQHHFKQRIVQRNQLNRWSNLAAEDYLWRIDCILG